MIHLPVSKGISLHSPRVGFPLGFALFGGASVTAVTVWHFLGLSPGLGPSGSPGTGPLGSSPLAPARLMVASSSSASERK